jgi:hypothetical protein
VPDFDFEAADTAATELELTAQALLAIAALIETDAPDVTADRTAGPRGNHDHDVDRARAGRGRPGRPAGSLGAGPAMGVS